ncbi:rab-GTPase-TBC domain-containing protein [Calycina marina]|uniref:Rab-GTPase-TBC domain-containing protein n=1 Tax=Calycina marina TaxID=1763456 RepID=A0A9P7Z0T5_9HELO|nr:rab-GTPase-TBC domain-containing protein [Calycina marina]
MEPTGSAPDSHASNREKELKKLLLSPGGKANDVKATSILEACKWKDVEKLRTLATEDGGLVSDQYRRQAWPLLLGCTLREEHSPVQLGLDVGNNWRDLPKHKDEDQVKLDVDRSFIYYPNNESAKEISQRKNDLSELILEVLRRKPYLHYFQGYHDICQVFLLVLNPPDRAPAVARLSALRIRDYMLPTLAPSLAQLRLIPSIIRAVNPELYNHLPLTQPFFAIPGIITMYAHDIQSYGEIARVFDVLLAREAVFSVYMFAQIVLQRADELFEIPNDEPELLHSVLSKLPKPLNLEVLIANTSKLLKLHPPEKLATWREISTSSVLKTARTADQVASQSLSDGHAYFKRQVEELRWAEQRDKVLTLMWRYRKPLKQAGVTVMIGVLAFYLKKSPGPTGVIGAFGRYWYGYHGH